MSRWHDTFKNHEIHRHLSNLQTTLKESVFKNLDAPTEQETSRLKKGLNLIGVALKAVDQEFVSQGQLDQISNTLAAIGQHLNNFKSSINLNEIQTANNYIDNVLSLLPALTAASLSKKGTAAASINAMIERAEEYLETLGENHKELQDKIARLVTSTTHAETRVAELQTRIDEKIAALDKLSSDWVQQFNDAQANREERFTTTLADIQDRATVKTDEIISDLMDFASGRNKDYSKKLDDYQSDAQKRHDDIRKLHSLIAEDAITGGHKSAAAEEAKTANLWRLVSIGFLVSAALWLGFVFMQADEISWKTSLAGFPLTFVFITTASYAAFQSNQHRRQSNRQRQFALEMIAIDPYLENLGEEERKKIKETLAAKYFGHVFDEKGAKADKDYTMLPTSLPEWLISLLTKSGQ